MALTSGQGRLPRPRVLRYVLFDAARRSQPRFRHASLKWGEKIQNELSTGWSRVIDHDLQGEIDGHTWTVDFPVYIDCAYQQGKYDEEGVARHGYAVHAPFIETPCQAKKYYSRRFGIESTYRLSERSIASTTTQNPAVRFLYVLISFLLQNA